MPNTQPINHPRKRKPKVHAVDLFCGAGGLTCGLRQAGIRVKAGIDNEGRCRHAYAANNKADFICRSVTEIHGADLRKYAKYADYTLLAGCAPCQPFSSYNRLSKPGDEKWNLLLEFARLVEETTPDLVTMENVPQLAGKDVFQKFVQRLEVAGYYRPDWRVVKCEDYGLPQHRHRLVLLASRLGPIRVLSPEEYAAPKRTVRDAIGSLPRLMAGSTCTTDPLHSACGLSPLNMARIKASRPGGTWYDWPDSLRSPCHKKSTGRTYMNVYGRMEWDQPSPTMTTQFIGFGTGRFGHPEQDRALSLREGALLQSFPKDYEFTAPGEPVDLYPVARMIGNAVPVVIGELIGRSIFKHLKDLKSPTAS